MSVGWTLKDNWTLQPGRPRLQRSGRLPGFPRGTVLRYIGWGHRVYGYAGAGILRPGEHRLCHEAGRTARPGTHNHRHGVQPSLQQRDRHLRHRACRAARGSSATPSCSPKARTSAHCGRIWPDPGGAVVGKRQPRFGGNPGHHDAPPVTRGGLPVRVGSAAPAHRTGPTGRLR